MPNHITNRLQITNISEENKNRFYSECFVENDSPYDEYTELNSYKLSFEKVIPYPEGFKEEPLQNIMFKDRDFRINLSIPSMPLMGPNNDPIDELNKEFEQFCTKLINAAAEKKIEHSVDEIKERIIPEFEKTINIWKNNYEVSNGCFFFYDFNVQHWGTKWDCYDFQGDTTEMSFNTAWSFPETIVLKISEEYNCRIDFQYADEDIGSNCGFGAMENGKVISYTDKDGDIAFALEIQGMDPEDYTTEDNFLPDEEQKTLTQNEADYK